MQNSTHLPGRHGKHRCPSTDQEENRTHCVDIDPRQEEVRTSEGDHRQRGSKHRTPDQRASSIPVDVGRIAFFPHESMIDNFAGKTTLSVRKGRHGDEKH